MSAIHYHRDTDGIVTLTLDMPGQSANTMNADFRTAFREALDRLQAEKDSINGILIASAKKTFFAGGDLRELVQVTPEHAETFFRMLQTGITGPLRELETLGVPVAAAINGAALGGGLELALACHYRVCLSDPKIKLGLPEVTLGLLPGGGGCCRLPRLLGIEKALPLLLEGKQLSPQAALKAGIIHALADSPDDMMEQARQWLLAHPGAKQPWDEKGFRIPGGDPKHPKVAQMLAIAPAMLRKKTRGCYPAPERIMAAVVEGCQVDYDTAQRIEGRYFTELACGQVSKNMIGTFWFGLNALKAGNNRPDGHEKKTFRKVGVLGAGMMGSGIAYATAIRGIDVVLKDVSQEKAEKGKDYSRKLLDKKVARGRMPADERDAVLNRIQATDSAADLSGCDLIIEAVFEASDLKAQVTRESEPMLAEGGIFASNTSTIPITQLAGASAQPEKFIGLHFFSPVDKMQLVEIIVGEKTDDQTLAEAFDYVLQIGKIPIVVNDSRGFFTSRVFGTFINEGIAMVGEGIHPASIEHAAQFAGMPVGPLALSDEVSLRLITHIRDQSRKDTEAQGGTWGPHPAERIVDLMVQEYKRTGKADGAGFYEYPEKGTKYLWPELIERFTDPDTAGKVDLQDLKDRFLYIQAIESVRCMEEGVLRSVMDANIGSIFGIGYAPWTGGVLQFINQTGPAEFVRRADALAERFGERFQLSGELRHKLEQNQLLE
ncbi:MAG: 3-hydroxyacyl-CoA dehydrogenase [Gammaproteobacteria bacterium]|nr:MAG: 3-hydroxyacyl-CoA dehydrogenase [Gammaproteobacteria bacterium]